MPRPTKPSSIIPCGECGDIFNTSGAKKRRNCSMECKIEAQKKRKLTEEHKIKIGESGRRSYVNNPERKVLMRNKFLGKKSCKWVGDKIGKYGIHDWIERIKGKASEHICELADKTCKGKMNWSNKSQKYLRRLSDWQTLCRSHHVRYDMAMLPNWKINIGKSLLKNENYKKL